MSLKFLKEEIEMTRALLVENRMEFLFNKYGKQFGIEWQNRNVGAAEETQIEDWAKSNGWTGIVDIDEPNSNSMFSRAPNKTRYIKPEVIFKFLCSYDPSRNKVYSQWLVTLALGGQMKLEDISRVRDELTTFDRVKSRMPVEQRDILRYKNSEDLYTAIQPYLEIVSQNDLNRQYEKQMYNEVIVRYNSPNYRIVTPKTKAAAQFFGMNTRWCTSAKESNNMFDSYNAKGPLYIILEKKTNQRWQFHPCTGEFRDETDASVDKRQFAQKHPEVAKYFISGILADFTFYEKYQGYVVGYDAQHGTITALIEASFGSNFIDLRIIHTENGSIIDAREMRKNHEKDFTRIAVPLIKVLNKAEVRGPNIEVMIQSGILYDVKTKTWMKTEDAAEIVERNNLVEHWGKISAGMLALSDEYFTDAEYYYYFMADGSTLWRLQVTENNELTPCGNALDLSDSEPERTRQPSYNSQTKRINSGYMLSSNDEQLAKKDACDIFGRLALALETDITLDPNFVTEVGLDPYAFMDEDLLKKVAAKNPELLTAPAAYKALGDTAIVRKKYTELFIDSLSKEDRIHDERWTSEGLVVKKFTDFEGLVEYFNTRENNLEELLDRDHFAYHQDNYSTDDYRSVMKELPNNELTMVGDYLAKNYPEVIEDLFDGEYDPSDLDHIMDVIEETDDNNITMACRLAFMSGIEAGAEKQAHESLMNAFNKQRYIYVMENGKLSQSITAKTNLDADFYIIVPLKDLAKHLQADPEYAERVSDDDWRDALDMEIHDPRPHYGWDEMDYEYALHILQDQLTENDVIS